MNTDRFTSLLLGSCIAACALLTPSPAAAQISALGASTPAASGVLSTFDYDDKHDVYLHVYEFQSRVWGRFVGASGALLGSPFVVSTWVAPTGFAGRPRVAYTRGSGADEFLVAYVSDINQIDRASNVYVQVVKYTGQGPTGGALIGNVSAVPAVFSALLQNLNAVVFNPLTSQFLIVWEESAGGFEIVARHVGLDGVPVGNTWNVSEASGSQGVTQAAFDNQRNRYLLAYVGDLAANSPVLGAFVRVLDGNTGQPTSSVIPLTLGTGAVLEPSVTYLPDRDGFLVTWTGFKPDRTVAARFVPSTVTTTLPEPAFLALDTPGGDGAASLTYDPTSHRVLVAAMSDPRYIRGTLLNGNGVPETAPFVLGTVPAGSGSYYPTVRPAEAGIVGLTYVIDYVAAVIERYQLDGGGAAPAPAPAPPPSVSNPRMAIDFPRTNATLQGSVTVAGWAIDLGPSGTSGVDAVHVWAYSTAGGAPQLLGVATTGFARPDVAGAFGHARFTSSGFAVTGTLPPGSYDLAVFAHSDVTATFNNTAVIRINVTVPQSFPRMWIDYPSNNQVVPHNFSVAGWALDLGAPDGTGVDAVHVWAYPAAGGAPILAGFATVGAQRADVGNAFGSSRFSASGYNLNVNGVLSSGTYDLVVFAHSTQTATFNNAQVVRIHVQ